MTADTYKVIDINNNTVFSASYDHKDTWNISIKQNKLSIGYDLTRKEAEQLYFLLVDTIGTPSIREIV